MRFQSRELGVKCLADLQPWYDLKSPLRLALVAACSPSHGIVISPGLAMEALQSRLPLSLSHRDDGRRFRARPMAGMASIHRSWF